MLIGRQHSAGFSNGTGGSYVLLTGTGVAVGEIYPRAGWDCNEKLSGAARGALSLSLLWENVRLTALGICPPAPAPHRWAHGSGGRLTGASGHGAGRDR